MKVKYKVVPVPITDGDKLTDFYVNQIRLTLNHDSIGSEQIRFVQLTLQALPALLSSKQV